ncbi:MAG TPA: MerR family transcriptional regulator [Ilumatobacteraceae bacterium]|jgi:DNA-binding transcriptional MerR regulator|nr:MerR family transcriptional regulator [Ilumatobacteraceae bacterium]
MIMQERPYLSIGEVLGLLLEEFPDVTISKIRFLESQGLIDPERTASGYRKFYDNDVDLLRVILREQRENFLPLRVIRDRLESGAIEDPTGPTTPPRGIRNVESSDDEEIAFAATSAAVETQHHPAGQQRVTPADLLAEMVQNGPPPVAHVVSAPVPRNESFLSSELCHLAGLTAEQLAELESYGLLTGKGSGATATYTIDDLAIAQAAAGFMQHGVEGRHLRAWRQAAEREASLFEQMILPLLRQRNPQARQQAVTTLEALSSLGGELRSAIVRSALSQYLDG